MALQQTVWAFSLMITLRSAVGETDASYVTANMTYVEYCQNKREVLLSSSQSVIICELSDDCLSNICTYATGSRDILSGYKLDLCTRQYTIVFTGEPFLLRLDKDTNVGFGSMRLHDWSEVPLAHNPQFVNITFRMVTRSKLGGTADSQVNMLAPATRDCSARSGHNSQKLGMIIGIVVGVLGGVVLFAVLAWWICSQRARARHVRLEKKTFVAQADTVDAQKGAKSEQHDERSGLIQRGKQVVVAADGLAPSV